VDLELLREEDRVRTPFYGADHPVKLQFFRCRKCGTTFTHERARVAPPVLPDGSPLVSAPSIPAPDAR
jgi:hypothetical protein